MFPDLKLPGMSGMECCQRIRKDFPDAAVLVITGYPSLFELADCRAAGFDDYFTKPMKLELLIRAAQTAFDKLGQIETTY